MAVHEGKHTRVDPGDADCSPRESAGDAFEKRHWSRLQLELWVCTRSKEAVRLAEHAPGSARLLDLNDDDSGPVFEDEAELIGVAIIRYGYVCSFDAARREAVMAQADGRLRAYSDPATGAEFFKGEDMLTLWPNSLKRDSEILRLAEAAAQLIRGRSSGKTVSPETWKRLRRRHGGKFPDHVARRIDQAGAEMIEMIRALTVEAWGRPCKRDGSTGRIMPTGGMSRITEDRAFLAEPLWADPCTDAIWTAPGLNEGSFHQTDGGYRDVRLDGQQFFLAMEGRRERAALQRLQQKAETSSRMSPTRWRRSALGDTKSPGDQEDGAATTAAEAADDHLYRTGTPGRPGPYTWCGRSTSVGRRKVRSSRAWLARRAISRSG